MSIESMSAAPEFDAIDGKPLTPEQKKYLNGFFNGLAAKGITFGDVMATPKEKGDATPLILEERLKKEEHPLDSYYRLVENALTNKAPDKEEVFRFKWNGLFYLNPVKDSFMARLRIPGGQLKSFQLREIAAVAQELTTGYIQITTRANLQIRLIQPKDTPEFLRIQSVGLHTRGAGADNIRNLTSNPTAGIDPREIIDCTPFVQELAQFILSQREFYDLPRKFNIAFDGGGLIGSVEDTNDIGIKAVKLGEEVFFRFALGGATGHKAFARDLGVIVRPAELVKSVVALLRVYIAHGNREDRKKARLKHLLEKWTLEQYLAETEKLLGKPFQRLPLDPAALKYPSAEFPHSHIGAFPQKQPGQNYLGVTLPAGQITCDQLRLLADIADRHGLGEIRLTVWENLIIPNIPDAELETVKREIRRIGLNWKQSNLSSGVIACTGNKYCKFSSTDTKGDALGLIKYLEDRIKLDVPVNIHLTGCPNSCAQHYIGDIGLLGTKTADGREAYHVFVGGGFGKNKALGRQIFQALPLEELKRMLETILRVYLSRRLDNETFQAFTTRHDVNALQTLFCQ